MSSNILRGFDELSDDYDEDWFSIGFDDDPLKITSPPGVGPNNEFGLNTRVCPSPLSHIPTREPYLSEPPPKLSPVSAEQQTFITLSNSRPPPPGPTQPLLQLPTPAQPSEIHGIEYDLGDDMGILSIPSDSPVLAPKLALDMQPSVSGIQRQQQQHQQQQQQHQQNGVILQSAQQQQQQQHSGCMQTVNGQWFVQAQVQHVQASGGTVITVLPNFCRPPLNGQSLSAAQASQMIGHSMSGGQTLVSTSSQQQIGLQSHPQQQQILHAPRAPNSVTAGVVSTTTHQQGQTVMQHLLSQPTVVRQPIVSPAQTVVTASQSSKAKPRNPQQRANGRRKNASQGGTVGAVLAKANKLAAAVSADPASGTRIQAPPQGIEMRLSVQSCEQVASLSKEISRLQNLQAMYSVDHSAEIKDLENKRAQIFFKALAQQHKDKDFLFAANIKAIPNSRQRNAASLEAAKPVVHQMQPSTSYELQPNYETVQPRMSSVSYQKTYQLQQFSNVQETSQRNSYDHRDSSTQNHSTTPSHFTNTYSDSTIEQIQIQHQSARNYILPSTTAQQSTIVLQKSAFETSTLISESICEIPKPTVPLYSPPILKTQEDVAADVAKKKLQRRSRLSDYFSSSEKSIEHADIHTQFHDLSDTFNRLLPFHVYDEPDLNDQTLDQFDHECLRHFVHLFERKNCMENKLRSMMLDMAQKGYNSVVDDCVLLSLDTKHEQDVYESERRLLNSLGADDFITNSQICANLDKETFEERQRQHKLKNTSKTQLHFEYQPFSETDIATRIIEPFSDTDCAESSNETEDEAENIDQGLSSCQRSIDHLDDNQIHDHACSYESESLEEQNERVEEEKSTVVGKEQTPEFDVEHTSVIDSPKKCESEELYGGELHDIDSPEESDVVPVDGEMVMKNGSSTVIEKSIPENTLNSNSVSEKICDFAEEIATSSSVPQAEQVATSSDEFETSESCAHKENYSKSDSVEANHVEVEHVMEESEAEVHRPPIRIKIALTNGIMRNRIGNDSIKKVKEKRKRKKKHRSHHGETLLNGDVNGVPPSCSNTSDETTSADVSHPRLLMRISRKNNVVCLGDRLNNTTIEEEAPPMKVPKIRIRLGRNPEQIILDPEMSNRITADSSDAMNTLNNTSGNEVAVDVAGSLVKNSKLRISYENLFAHMTSGAQYSPSSGCGDEASSKSAWTNQRQMGIVTGSKKMNEMQSSEMLQLSDKMEGERNLHEIFVKDLNADELLNSDLASSDRSSDVVRFQSLDTLEKHLCEKNPQLVAALVTIDEARRDKVEKERPKKLPTGRQRERHLREQQLRWEKRKDENAVASGLSDAHTEHLSLSASALNTIGCGQEGQRPTLPKRWAAVNVPVHHLSSDRLAERQQSGKRSASASRRDTSTSFADAQSKSENIKSLTINQRQPYSSSLSLYEPWCKPVQQATAQLGSSTRLTKLRPKSGTKAAGAGPMSKLNEWLDRQQRVQIVLRGRSSPNRIIYAAIIAFDKHWNLLIRDGDELFLPSAKQERRWKQIDKLPQRYSMDQKTRWRKTVWRRHLKCSLIRGDDVVVIREFGIPSLRKTP